VNDLNDVGKNDRFESSPFVTDRLDSPIRPDFAFVVGWSQGAEFQLDYGCSERALEWLETGSAGQGARAGDFLVFLLLTLSWFGLEPAESGHLYRPWICAGVLAAIVVVPWAARGGAFTGYSFYP
jgi:hypothetical protein